MLVGIFCLGLTAHFVHHAIQGRHGLEARSRLIARHTVLQRETAGLEVVRARLERDRRLLDQPVPDADLVEEIAREQLGFARPGDIVVMTTPRSGP